MRRLLVLPLCFAMALSGCASTGGFLSNVVVSMTSATPTQVKTVDEAVKAVALAERSLDTVVLAGTFDGNKPVLQQLKTDVVVLHGALVATEVANASGNSAAIAAALATFNEALAAYNSYKALKGIA